MNELAVSREIQAPAELVWDLISDVTRMGEWSPETDTAEWLDGFSGPTPGAKFRGTNRLGNRTWKTTATVLDADRGRKFSFRVDVGRFKIAEWTFEFESTATGCRVTESWIDRRGRLLKAVGKALTGVADRVPHNRKSMERTLSQVAAEAESQTESTS